MKPKTFEKLLRKFSHLPSHYIDSSVILGAFLEDGKFREECKSYLNRVVHNYRGFLPVSVVGEIFMILDEKIEKEGDKELFFSFFNTLIRRRKIEFIGSGFEDYRKTQEIKDVSYDAEPLDTLHLAIAITNKANVFVTLDEKLIHNQAIENTFKINILHPKEL
ncbi:MAG: type II toxin-antitoxin system VapC family toxin [Candidatus Aenigmarchaeota archaeon]|nr:type II toxin-antitoxin system VapC family toxin [Candidatus Aenigmarchaeota archaeon]